MYQDISKGEVAPTLQGVIKLYLSQKGYGFITCPEAGGDVYFQTRHLPEDLQVSLPDEVFSLKGLPCIFEHTLTQDGKPQARNVKVVGGEGVYMIGVVKTYSPKNLYGFINSCMLEGDLYFKAKDLPPPLQQTDIRGAKVRFAVTSMKDGKMQARDLIVLNAGMPMQQMPAQQMPMQQMPMQQMPMQQMPMQQSEMAAQPAMGMPPGAGMGMIGHMLADGSQMVGNVKSFDAAKGYGFIRAPNFPMDVYFKPDPSRGEGYVPGQEVTFFLKYTADGRPQAREVSRPMQTGESCAGVVRRYNPLKGFGFLNVEGRTQDVYFQKVQLAPEIQEMQLEGAQFHFTVNMNGGRIQAQDLQLFEMPPQGMKRPAEGPPALNSFDPKRPRPNEMQNGMARPSMAQQAAMSMAGLAAAPMGAPMGVPMGQQMGMPMAAPTPTPQLERYQGTVKSYNPTKGFGFILSPSVPGDVYFNAKNLQEPFRAMQLDHRQVSFTTRYTTDGKVQANNVQVH